MNTRSWREPEPNDVFRDTWLTREQREELVEFLRRPNGGRQFGDRLTAEAVADGGCRIVMAKYRSRQDFYDYADRQQQKAEREGTAGE